MCGNYRSEAMVLLLQGSAFALRDYLEYLRILLQSNVLLVIVVNDRFFVVEISQSNTVGLSGYLSYVILLCYFWFTWNSVFSRSFHCTSSSTWSRQHQESAARYSLVFYALRYLDFDLFVRSWWSASIVDAYCVFVSRADTAGEFASSTLGIHLTLSRWSIARCLLS